MNTGTFTTDFTYDLAIAPTKSQFQAWNTAQLQSPDVRAGRPLPQAQKRHVGAHVLNLIHRKCLRGYPIETHRVSCFCCAA